MAALPRAVVGVGETGMIRKRSAQVTPKTNSHNHRDVANLFARQSQCLSSFGRFSIVDSILNIVKDQCFGLVML